MMQCFESLDANEIAERVSLFVSDAIKREVSCSVVFSEDYLCAQFQNGNRLTNEEVNEVYRCLEAPTEDHREVNLASDCETVPDLGEEFLLDILKQSLGVKQDREIGILNGRILIRI